MNHNLVRKILAFGDRYIADWLTYDRDKNKLQNNWWEGAKFFIGFLFYQGRKDAVSDQARFSAICVLDDLYSTVTAQRFPEIIDAIKLTEGLSKVLGKRKIGKGRDIQMTVEALQLISKLANADIIAYTMEEIKQGRTKVIYDYLKSNIFGAGDKVISFFLRDFIMLFGLDEAIYSCCQLILGYAGLLLK